MFKGDQSACAVQFSPFTPGRLAVATSQNFGVVGNGRVSVLQQEQAGLQHVVSFDTADATLDVAWSEANENIVASCSGDGSIKLWDVSHGQNARPLRHLSVHTKEAVSLDWNVNHTQLFLSSSWDDTVKLWNATDAACVRSFERHTYCVYAVKWNPQHGDIFLSVSGDCSAMVWDARQAAPSLILKAHPREILTGDWCKYNDCVVATGSIDKSIKIWDVRNPSTPTAVLLGHSYPVRKLAFSPHVEPLLVSCSYDMTVRLWDIAAGEDPLINVWQHHSEFAVGVDWDVLSEGMLASCGWDATVRVWHRSGQPA